MREIDRVWTKHNSFVICKICKGKFLSLTNTHLKKHRLTQNQYRTLFPFEQQHSMDTLMKIRENGLRNKDEFMKHRITPNEKTIKKANEKLKEKIKLYKKTFGKWDFRTEESFKKQSRTMKKKVKEGKWVNPLSSIEARKKVSEKAKERYKNPSNWVGIVKKQLEAKR